MRVHIRSFSAILMLAAIGCLAPAGAEAAFPGANGRIAFGGQGAIFSMNSDGSGQGVVTRRAYQPAWSADGARIAFARSGIGVINADGTNRRQLTTAGTDVEPTWSPDGRQVAYSSSAPGGGIYVMNADGKGARRLTSDVPPASSSSPAWSPDGGRIAFTRLAMAGSYLIRNVYVMNADGSGVVHIASGPPSSFGYESDSTPNWSPDGQRLAVAHGAAAVAGGRTQIHLINSDGSGRTNISADPSSADGDPAWSPDGRLIAFLRNQHIYVMNADGSNPRQLTSGHKQYASVDWGSGMVAPSPSGLKLTVTGPRTQSLDRRNRLYVFARCNITCGVAFSASVRVGGKRVQSKKGGGRLGVGRKKLRLKFLRDPARVIRRALHRGPRPVVRVELKASEPLSEAVTVVRRIKVR